MPEQPLPTIKRKMSRKTKLGVFSIPQFPSEDSDDGVYYSEPESYERHRSPYSRIDWRHLPRARSSSLTTSVHSPLRGVSKGDKLVLEGIGGRGEKVEKTEEVEMVRDSRQITIQSEDEDGTLFKTLTSEGAEQVKEAAAAMTGWASPYDGGDGSPKTLMSPRKCDFPSLLPSESVGIFDQLLQEVRGVPETANTARLPPSFLADYAILPAVIEYVLNHGIFVCLSGLLYELTFMPISGLVGAWKLLTGLRQLTHIEKSDLIRTSILLVGVFVFGASVDFSGVYHYIRAQSLLKLYFIFNMLEIIERLVRSWGNDLVDGLVKASVEGGIVSVMTHWLVVLLYTLVHAYIHFWRVMLISVAMLANDMLIVLVTNNFNELKGSVFKKMEPRSVYPIIASDVVERVYLYIDVALVLFRMTTSPQRSKMPFDEVSYWIGFMIALEILTDWLKFLCISKFNQIDISTFWHYHRIHRDDVLNSRNLDVNPLPPLVQKGFVSASHLPPRRMNFMPTPLAILILCNIMLPNMVGSETVSLWVYRGLVVAALFLAKIIVDWLILGEALRSDRTGNLPEKLQSIRAL